MEIWFYEEETNNVVGMIESFSSICISSNYDTPSDIKIITPIEGELIVQPNMIIYPSGGREAFIVETVEKNEDKNGNKATISGRSLTSLLDRRCLYRNKNYNGNGGLIIKGMMDDTFSEAKRQFAHFTYDINVGLGTSITYSTTPMSLLEAITNTCKASGLGMICEWDKHTHSAVFRIIEGIDRTKNGNTGMVVTFSLAHENITNVNYVDSVASLNTALYVMGEANETGNRKFVEVDPFSYTGYRRFEGIYESGQSSVTDQSSDNSFGLIDPWDDSGEASPPIILSKNDYRNALITAGMEEIQNRTRIKTAEGDLVVDSKLFTLGVDYFLGDIVAVENKLSKTYVESRIVGTEESFENGMNSTRIIIGDRMPTMIDQIKRYAKGGK
jgi:hypothetical protein